MLNIKAVIFVIICKMCILWQLLDTADSSLHRLVGTRNVTHYLKAVIINHRGLAGFQPISSSTYIYMYIYIYPFQISKCVNSSQHKLEFIWIYDWVISGSVTWRLGSKRKYVFEWYRIHLRNPFIAPRVGDYGCYPQVSPAVCRGRLGGWAPFIGTSGILVSYLVSLAGSKGKMFWIFVSCVAMLLCYTWKMYRRCRTGSCPRSNTHAEDCKRLSHTLPKTRKL